MASSKKVAFLLYEGCTLLDFAGATQIFAPWASGWEPIWVAEKAGPVKTSEGLSVIANHGLDDDIEADVIFVPGGAGHGVQATMESAAHIAWLQRMASDPARWVGAVCVGTFILATAGVLKGAQVTTHWMLLEELRRLQTKEDFTVAEGYPRSVLDRTTKRFTGGGVSASIDLALQLVADLSTLEQANVASLITQYEPDLPEGVLPGTPRVTSPATLKLVIDNPQIAANFVRPIGEGVTELLEA